MNSKSAICLFVDGLHAGMVGAYGNSWIRTPALDRLATESFVFDQAFVESPTSEAIGRSLFDGVDAWGVSTTPLLAEVHRRGVRSLLMTDDAELAQRYGDRFQEAIVLPSEVPDRLAEEIADTQLARFFAAATELLERLEEPFLLCLHTRSLASTWDAPYALRDQYTEEDDPEPPDFASAANRVLETDFDPDVLLGIVHAYAGQVSLLDACFGLWLAAWKSSSAAVNTLLSVMGWRGFALGEHGRVGLEENQLAGEIVQIPWMLRLPDGQGALGRTSSLVRQSDLGATLLDWYGIAAAEQSVLPIVEGERDELRQAIYLRSATERAIRTPAWHLRLSGEEENLQTKLFAKATDRWEVNEVSDRCPDIVDSLKELLVAKEQGRDAAERLATELVTQID